MPKVKHYNSTTTTVVPASASLLRGELAINITDKKLWVGDASGDPVLIADYNAGSSSSVTISDTAPSSPSNGDLWWDSSIGNLNVWYEDGTSNQWVSAGKGGGSTPSGVLKSDGTVSLTANWDAGAYEIRALTFQSDVTTGTAPLTVASTTLVTNLNADQVDGNDASDIVLKTDVDDTPVDTATTVPISSNWAYDHENDADPHTQYVQVAGDTMTGNLILDPTNDDVPVMALKASTTALTCQYQFHINDIMRGQIQCTTGNIQFMKRDVTAAITSQIMVSDSNIVLRLDDNTDEYNFDTSKFNPVADNNNDLGTASLRWKDIYSYQFHSYITTGTAPLTVASTTVVANLNADQVDGKDYSDLQAEFQPHGALTGRNYESGTTYTLVVGDAGKMVEMDNAAAITVTVNNSIFSEGDIVHIFQMGAGQVTVSAGSGVTFLKQATFNAKTFEQYSIITLYFRSASSVVLGGSLEVA